MARKKKQVNFFWTYLLIEVDDLNIVHLFDTLTLIEVIDLVKLNCQHDQVFRDLVIDSDVDQNV